MDPYRPPIAFAHRGARSMRPDNTLEAFALALELGATGLETDAWLTGDGVVVLDHDGVTGRLGRRRPIAAARRRELAPHVPSLRDLYDRCGVDFELSIDVKDAAALPPLVEVARGVGGEDRLWLCHGDGRDLSSWRGVSAVVRLVHSTRLDRMPGGVAAHARRLASGGTDAINLRHTQWTPERIASAHDAGVRALGWDAQSEAAIAGLLAAGADGIYSDHVDRLVRVIGSGTEPGPSERSGSEPPEARQRPHPDEGAPDDEALRDGADHP